MQQRFLLIFTEILVNTTKFCHCHQHGASSYGNMGQSITLRVSQAKPATLPGISQQDKAACGVGVTA